MFAATCLCFLLLDVKQVCTAGCLSFYPMAQCVVHALKGLACRARVTPASSPVLHAHADVTKSIQYFSMGPKLNYVCTCCVQISGCINVSANGVVDSLRTLPRIQQLSLARLPLTSLTPTHLLEATASLWLETLDLTNCVQLDAGWFVFFVSFAYTGMHFNAAG